IKIAAYAVTPIGGFLTWLVIQHFALKSKVSLLAKDLEHNAEADKEGKDNFTKLWGAIENINTTLSRLEADIRVLTERIKP
ncbi:MAG: hypothetical protein ACR2PH_10750, partial [Desulfobulbia bacterium]